MLQLGQQRKRKSSSTHAYSLLPTALTTPNNNKSTSHANGHNGDGSKTKDGTIKVVLSLFGLMLLVFLMFSVFQPKQTKDSDRPPLHVVMEQQNPPHVQPQHPHIKNPHVQYPPPNLHKHSDADSEPSAGAPKQATNHEQPPKLPPPKPQSDVDIEIIDSSDHDKNDEKAPSNDAIANNDEDDFYGHASNLVRPPQSILVPELSSSQITQFFDTGIDARDRFYASNTPGVDHDARLYLMNYIFLPYEHMMAIFLLTSEYLDPAHGLHAWPSKRRRSDLPDLYKNIRGTIYKQYKSVTPPFACVFRVDRQVWVSPVDFVPNNTTRDRYVNEGTEIMRCHVPLTAMNEAYSTLGQSSVFFDANATFSFVLTQKWQHLLDPKQPPLAPPAVEGVHASLSMKVGARSGVHLYDHDEALIYKKANQARFLTLCMPPISEPLAFLAETVAHYISNLGVEHIYIGTFFAHDKTDAYRAKLMERIRPWYEQGFVTIWPHEQPWIEFTDKAKSHWLNQCLYYAKSRDSYTLSLDADELLVLTSIDDMSQSTAKLTQHQHDEEHQKTMQTKLSSLVKSTVGAFEDANDHFCWLTFESYQMWHLLHPDEPYMVRRFIGREQKAQLTWSKVIWNTKHLHFTGYHAGGACTAQNHDWRQVVNDWRESRDAKHVYRFNAVQEGALLHYYNCRQVRIEPKDPKLRNPWSRMENDTRMMDVYWTNIEHDFKRFEIPATYPDESDVMNTKYYRDHYGFGNSMANWVQKYTVEDKQ